MKPYALYPKTNGVDIRIHYAGPQGEILHVWKIRWFSHQFRHFITAGK